MITFLGKKDPSWSPVGRYETWRMPDPHRLKHDEGCSLILLIIHSHPKIEHNELFELLKPYNTYKTAYDLMFHCDLTFLNASKMVDVDEFINLKRPIETESWHYSITQLGIDVLKQNRLVKVDQ